MSETMNPDLPNHVISTILHKAELNIDTRRALKIRPGDVSRFITTNAYSCLSTLFETRLKMWQTFVKNNNSQLSFALGNATSQLIRQPCPRQNIQISVNVWYIDGRVLMQIEKLLLVEARLGSRWEHLGGEAFKRGSVHCDVQTGEIVPRFMDSDTDSDDEEDMDFDL